MSLGEAFIEVRADTRPFVRDLDRQVRTAVQRVENAINQQFGANLAAGASQAGQRAGTAAGDSFNRGMRNSLFFGRGGNQNIFIALASSLASALDDGISALPTELKAAIVLGVILASPLIGAMIGAAITTGMALSVAGIGVLLASQFESVQERATEFGRRVRMVLSLAAESFGPAIINALDMIESKIHSLSPVLTSVFENASKFLEPLTAGLLAGLDAFVNMLDRTGPQLQEFVDIFALGIQGLLETVSEGLERLANTGDAGEQALRDLFIITNALIGAFFGMIELLTFVNQLFHELADIAMELNPILGLLVRIILKDLPDANAAVIVTNTDAAASFNGVVAATKGEEKAAKDLIKALDSLVDATYDNIQVDIDFERSLDRISESLKENGKTLDIHGEKGRKNVESFLKGLKDAEERAINRLQVQGYTTAQAAALYDQEIAQLRNVARQAGITDQQFNALFGDIIAVSQLRLSSEEMGVDGLAAGLDDATASALALLNLINTLKRSTISGAVGGAKVPGFADGDIVDRPTLGVFGEAGPEVIIPLTQPARAAQLAQESGLTAMIGANGTMVLVFIGDEQLETKMVKVVERNNRNQKMALTQGPRRF